MFIKNQIKDIVKCMKSKDFNEIQKTMSCLNHLFPN